MPIKDVIKKQGKRTAVLVICGVLGLALLLSAELFGGIGKKENKEYSVSYYTSELEGRIEKLCLAVDGISHAEVLLTLDCSSEYVYAKDENASTSASEYVIISGGDGEEAVPVSEIYPRIRGVAVVCTGGDSAAVQKKLTELLSAALGISANKIKIVGGGRS